MRFNYLNHAPPFAIDRLCNMCMSEELRTPLAALVTALIVVFCWWALERHWLIEARREERTALSRLMESRGDLAQVRMERVGIDHLVSLDRRLRELRTSGSRLAANLSSIGNRVPRHVWLTSLSSTSDGVAIVGRADGLQLIGETMSHLMSSASMASPNLVRAERDNRDKRLFAFTIVLEKKDDNTQ